MLIMLLFKDLIPPMMTLFTPQPTVPAVVVPPGIRKFSEVCSFNMTHADKNSRTSRGYPSSSTSYEYPSTVRTHSQHGPRDPVVVETPSKPQCWDHGCNGRQFSTFSNLLRHQREKSGSSTKSICHRCGAEFTRKTARDGHLAHDKCKQKSPGR